MSLSLARKDGEAVLVIHENGDQCLVRLESCGRGSAYLRFIGVPDRWSIVRLEIAGRPDVVEAIQERREGRWTKRKQSKAGSRTSRR